MGTLGFWARKLRRDTVESASSADGTGGFVELLAGPEIVPEQVGAAIEIVRAGDRRVVLRGESDRCKRASYRVR